MKTLLMRPATGMYLQGLGKWTSDPERAFDFKLIDRALKFVEIWRLKDVELAFACEDMQHIVEVPVEKAALGFTRAGLR